LDAARQVTWILPVVWCAITASIIALGLQVPMAGGTAGAGFGYVFEVAGYGADFRKSLALYSAASAVLGVAFMFAPKVTSWPIRKAMAWPTLMLMAVGGILMLIVPQALIALAAGSGERATGVAQVWSITWMEAGSRISLAGVLVGLATFLDAFLNRKRGGYSPASSS
jgi:hypothetical protein